MFIKELYLKNYRNYKAVQLQFLPGIYLVKGANGQGKSNLLEAIFNLCSGQSYRTNKDFDLVFWNEFNYSLKGTVYAHKRLYKVEIEYDVAKQKKQFKVNNKKEAQFNRKHAFPIVFFVPEDLELIRRGPHERRRFLDKTISHMNPLYADYLKRYHKIVFQKNKLLKSHVYERENKKLVDSWNKQMIYFGSRIMWQRKETILKWSKLAHNNFKILFGLKHDLELIYQTSLGEAQNIPDNLPEIEENFYHKLEMIKKEELKKGFALLGPHRDDLLFLLEGREAKRFASHGQQKSIIMALKAAQIQDYSQNKEKPLFLLDDVFSELDETRRQQCFFLFRDAEQVFLTLTKKKNRLEYYLRNFLPNAFLDIAEGNVEEFKVSGDNWKSPR